MYYASKSIETDDFIKASDVSANEQQALFYCPCPTCRCPMGIRAINSNKRKANFFKLPSSEHTETCFVPYIKSEEGNVTDYETESLEPEELLKKLQKKSNPQNNNQTSPRLTDKTKLPVKNENLKPISTIRQLHAICASNVPEMEIREGVRVKDLYVGKNTSAFYKKDISGIKLVECKYINRYDKIKQNLYFSYSNNEGELKICVHISDGKLFWKICHLLWNFTNPVIIYAEWTNNSCEVTSNRQLVPLKR